MKSNPLTKKEYPSKHLYDSKENIRRLVLKDEVEIETVVDLSGRAGRPIPQPLEVVF